MPCGNSAQFGGTEQVFLNTTTNAITGTRFITLPGGGQAVRTGAGSAYSFEIGGCGVNASMQVIRFLYVFRA